MQFPNHPLISFLSSVRFRPVPSTNVRRRFPRGPQALRFPLCGSHTHSFAAPRRRQQRPPALQRTMRDLQRWREGRVPDTKRRRFGASRFGGMRELKGEEDEEGWDGEWEHKRGSSASCPGHAQVPEDRCSRGVRRGA